MDIKPGLKLRGTRCATEVIVVRPPSRAVELACCGAPLTDQVVELAAPASNATLDGEPVVLGKRYAAEDTGLELLCTKPGPGPLTADGVALLVKGAKPLPASD